jgi:ABC-2 type transport system permease protein
MEVIQFKDWVFGILIGNIIYICIVYNLWKGIFVSSRTDSVNGMTFSDTMVYLVLASAIFTSMGSYLVWDMHSDIQSGKISLDIIKPVGYQSFQFFMRIGINMFWFITTFIPTFVIVYFLSNFSVPLSYNVVFFLISMLLGMIMMLCIDFFIGTICLYTQSVWGINIMKEVVVLLLSGATIPINFFPEPLKSIVFHLPFHAIFNTPLLQLIDTRLKLNERLLMLGIQLLWLVILSTLSQMWWKKSVKIITINGG